MIVGMIWLLQTKYSWILAYLPVWNSLQFLSAQILLTYLILIIGCLDIAPFSDGLGDDLPLIAVFLQQPDKR